MQIIDTHIHMDSLERSALEAMALAGVTAVVADGSPMPGLAPASETVFDFYERTLGYDATRGAEFFIDVYVMLGINMFFVPRDYEKVLESLPKYVSRDKVVSIGEIGLDPRSETCPDLSKQEEIIKACLKIAKEHDKTVLFHTPTIERPKWVERYFKLIQEAKLEPSKVIMSHADSSIIKMITDCGCVAGITVQPWRKITPQDAAKMLQGSDIDRVLVDSDSSLRFGSDPLGVAKTALEMRTLGFQAADIKRVVYENPIRVFDLPLALS